VRVARSLPLARDCDGRLGVRFDVHLLVSIFVLFVTAFVPVAPAPDTTWPQFRGPSGRAVSAIGTLPTKWSTTINVAWHAVVPGRGWSSPIVWGDQVILTSAVGAGAFKRRRRHLGNDYVAELRSRGLDEQVMEKLRLRDLESPQEAGDLQFMV
jgi:hypothetical protein